MDLAGLLDHYGYLAVFIGTLLEGESMLLLGGYAAHRGYLEPAGVIGTAYVAAVVSDQVYFHLGRRHGARWLASHPRFASKVSVAVRLLDRRGTWVVLAMRFLWGFRIALPLAAGLSGMDPRRYLALDLIASAVWASFFGFLGLGGSRLLAMWIEDLHRHEGWIVGGLIAIALGVIAWRWRAREPRAV